MSTPGGFVAWAQKRGCSPYHPDTWTPEDHAAYYAYKLAWFKALMQLYKLMPKLTPRETLKSRIREALDRLNAPPPSRPYTGACPCHPFAPKTYTPDKGPHGLVYLDSFRRRRA